MRIAVTGAGGLLGSELCRQLAGAAIPLEFPAFDLTDPASVRRGVEGARPEAVINTAAYTQVDAAEKDAETCRAVNVAGVRYLAETCGRVGANLVQVSTDYVFGGDLNRRTPYRESDPPVPQGIYAKSKLDGEREAAACGEHLIVRSCGLFGRPGPRTVKQPFVDAMLALGARGEAVRVVDDQWVSPTYAIHMARAILFLLVAKARGTYHVVNAGCATWRQVAEEIFRQAGLAVEVHPITTAEFGADAPRPAYSVLDASKYRSLGGPPLPAWQDALAEYLASRKGEARQ
jgi:dTDP-4-dehydrorhamnose reductase